MAFENLGRSALILGRLDDAERAFERALQINPNLYVPALELAKLSFDRGDFRTARALYSRFITNKDFYGLPHSPRSLWVGIQIEREFQNDEIVEGYARVFIHFIQHLRAEYWEYRSSLNEN